MAIPPDSGLDAKLDRAVPTGEPEAFLVGVGGLHGGRVYPLSHNTTFVGRAADADVLVSDPSISARHARLINGSQGFEIEDLESTNGTFVEGRRVSRAPLRTGDQIVLGQVEFKFLIVRRVDATMMILPAGMPGAPRQSQLVRQEPVRRAPPPSGQPPYVPPNARKRDEEEGPSLEEIVTKLALGYRFLGRHITFIGWFVGVGVIVALLSVLALPPPGEVTCVLKLTPEIKANPVDAQWNRAGDGQEVRFFDGAEKAFVLPDLVAGTMRKLYGKSPSTETAKEIAGRLRLEGTPEHVYRATYRESMFGAPLKRPADFLSAHIENYLHDEITRAIRVFAAQADFLRSQLKSVEVEMSKIRDEKMRFSQKNSDRLPEEAKQMLGSRFELETRRAELSAQVRRLSGELDAQRRALTLEGPLAQQKFHASQSYRDSLATLNRKLSEAYARGLAEGHPEVRQIKEEKQQIEALIQKEMVASTNPLDRESSAGYQELRNRVALLQAQVTAARSDLADTEKTLGRVVTVVGDLPRVQAGVQQLSHMEEATTTLHSQLFDQLKKAELQLNLERVSAESRYEVVSAPQLYKTGRLKTAIVRLVLGAFAGLAAAAIVLAFKKAREVFSSALSTLESSESRSAR